MCDRVIVGDEVSLLHRPVYTYAQVDRLLKLSSGTARRWIQGYRRRGVNYRPVVRPGTIDSTWVVWGEYIEARLLSEWRDTDNVPMHNLRRIADSLRAETGLEFPLAYHQTLMQPLGREMVWRAQQDSELPDDFATEVGSGQIVWTAPVERFIEAATFQPDVTPEARRLIAEMDADDGFPHIKLNPRRRGGEPVVHGHNVRAATIAALVAAGEDPAEVARWYLMSEDQVDEAVRYVESHPRVA